MSDPERPETFAFRELEQLVRNLGEELAAFRQRALVAEARLKDLDDTPGDPGVGMQLSGRLVALEEENARLKSQLESATARTRQVLDRIRFMRQQAIRGIGADR